MSQVERHKKLVYAAAIIFTIIVAILIFCSYFIFDGAELCSIISSIVAYFILTIVYTWTLKDFSKAMKGLLADQINKEKGTVLNQFIFFLVSFVTRLVFFILELIL